MIAQGKQMNEMHVEYEKKLGQLRIDLASEFATEVKSINKIGRAHV